MLINTQFDYDAAFDDSPGKRPAVLPTSFEFLEVALIHSGIHPADQ